MKLYSNQIITNIVNNPLTRKTVSRLSNPSALLPIILLEGAVIGGRSYQANKRGGWIEARERITEEITASIVWLFGISALNKTFDKIFEKMNVKGLKHDVGKDALYDPFKLVITKNTNLSAIKFGKIAFAAAVGILLCGNVIPKLNQKITKAMTGHKENNSSKPEPKTPKSGNRVNMNDFLASAKAKTVSFTNSAMVTNFLRTAAHNLEHNDIAKLLTIDTGILTGRTKNARNNDEKIEIGFREIASSYFYMFAAQHVYKGLSKTCDNYKGITNLDPNVTAYLDKKIRKAVSDEKNRVIEANTQLATKTENCKELINNQKKLAEGMELTTAKFKELLLGNSNAEYDKIVQNIRSNFKGKTIKFSELKDLLIKNAVEQNKIKEIMEKAEKITKIRSKNAVSKELLSLSEVYNCMYSGLINEPNIARRLTAFGTCGDSRNSKKFVSMKTIDNSKKQVYEYVENLIKYANDKNAGVITTDILTQVKNRNTIMKFGFISAGLAISALFLSTIIPKVQYMITAKRTGNSEFPGARDLDFKTK